MIKKLVVAVISVLLVGGVLAQAPMPQMPSTMGPTMNPNTYMGLMGTMMTPDVIKNPSMVCAKCHDGKDMARYQKSLLPMYNLMMNPANWMNPSAYMGAMRPAMDPSTYTEWYNAWMQRYNPAGTGK